MSELKKEELLKWLEDLKEDLKTAGWDDEIDEQAYRQIKQMIQRPEMTKEFIDEQVDLIYRRVAVYTQNNVFPFEDVIKEAIRRTIKEMPAKKPTVTEKWIQGKAEDTANDYPDVAFPNLITIFKKLLREAGVEVSG